MVFWRLRLQWVIIIYSVFVSIFIIFKKTGSFRTGSCYIDFLYWISHYVDVDTTEKLDLNITGIYVGILFFAAMSGVKIDSICAHCVSVCVCVCVKYTAKF